MTTLRTLAAAVVANWEKGDLATAVREMSAHLDVLTADRNNCRSAVDSARTTYSDGDVSFDDCPDVAPAEGGAHVAAWVWVPDVELFNKKVYVCSRCGSPELTQDASVRMNTEEVNIFDDVQCQCCGAEGHSVAMEVEVPEEFDVDDDIYDFETLTTKVKA